MTRLTQRDRDFFESHPLVGIHCHRKHRVLLRQEVEALLRRGGDGFNMSDMTGVLTYLSDENDHDSEGRDLGIEKHSFSRNELNVAMRHSGRDRFRYLQYRFRFNEYPRRKTLSDFPILLAIEPTSICNLRCVMCFQADPHLNSDHSVMGRMDFNLFRRIVDEGESHGLCAIVLASRGEPLLHSRISDMVAYAKDHGVLDVKLNTNATQLTAQKSRELLCAGLDTIVFSVDSYRKEEFEAIRPPAKFERVLHNIEQFREVREREFPYSHTRSRVSMVQINADQDVKGAEAFWQDKVDEFGVRWAVDRLKIYELEDVEMKRPCSMLWERLYVWFNGVINPCDEDYRSIMSPGTLDGIGSIKAAWLSDTMDTYRSRHMAQQKNTLIPCTKCHGF